MFISMLLLTCAIGAEPMKPSRTEQVARVVSPVAGVFITVFESAERIGEEMIRGETEWAPASALTAIAMAEIAKAAVPRPLPADHPRAILSLPLASALDVIRVESQIDSEPTSALSALGVDQVALSPVTAEVAVILDKWGAASRDVTSSQFEIQRTVYNLAFETEQRAGGELFCERPDKVSVVLRPTKIPKGMAGARRARNGNAFRLESGPGESWIWTADELAMANDEERTYERYQIAPPSRFLLAPSFLLDASTEKLRKECELSLLSVRDDGVVLKVVPRTAVLKQFFFSECLLLIDNKTWQVSAVKYYDPSGNLETVYKLGKRIINEPLPADCFDPPLKWPGYKQLKLD